MVSGQAAERRKLNRLEPSLSGMTFLWGVKKNHPELAHHTIFFSADYRREFDQIFNQLRAPDDPTVYVAITSRADALFRDASDPVKGNPQGRVTIVEFFDARCGYCKQLHPTMEQLIQRERDVRVVMKDLPILGPPAGWTHPAGAFGEAAGPT